MKAECIAGRAWIILHPIFTRWKSVWQCGALSPKPSPESAGTVYVAASLLHSLALTGPASLKQRRLFSRGGPALHGAASGLLASSTRSGGSNALRPIRPVVPFAIHRTGGAATGFHRTGLTALSSSMPQHRSRQQDGLLLRVWTPVLQGKARGGGRLFGLDHEGMSPLGQVADPARSGVAGPQGRPDLQALQRPLLRPLEKVAPRSFHEQLPRKASESSGSPLKLLLKKSESIPSSKAPTTAAANTPGAPGRQATAIEIKILRLCQGVEEGSPKSSAGSRDGWLQHRLRRLRRLRPGLPL